MTSSGAKGHFPLISLLDAHQVMNGVVKVKFSENPPLLAALGLLESGAKASNT